MSIAQIAVFYLVIWWLVLFVTLPFGIRRLEDPEPGMEPGAPEKPRMWIKVAVTTLAAAAITVAVYVAVESGWLPLREWLRPTEIIPGRGPS